MDETIRTMSHNVTSHGTQHGAQRDVTVHEAAAALGLSEEAVRARLRRGSLDGYKADDDTWRVKLPEGAAFAADHPSVPDYDRGSDDIDAAFAAPVTPVTSPSRDGTHHDTSHEAQRGTQRDVTDDALVTHLQDEVVYLRERLEDAMGQLAEERRRADVLQREALGRIEALSATVDRETSPEHASEAVAWPESIGEHARGESVEPDRHTRLAAIVARLRRLIAGDR